MAWKHLESTWNLTFRFWYAPCMGHMTPQNFFCQKNFFFKKLFWIRIWNKFWILTSLWPVGIIWPISGTPLWPLGYDLVCGPNFECQCRRLLKIWARVCFVPRTVIKIPSSTAYPGLLSRTVPRLVTLVRKGFVEGIVRIFQAKGRILGLRLKIGDNSFNFWNVYFTCYKI